MDERLPLPALLSQALVAFTIEFDNEFEHLVPHRTTEQGRVSRSESHVWLVSMVMWLMLMRFVPESGIAAEELKRRSGLTSKEMRLWLTRMSKWWSYVTVDRVEESWFVQPTAAGRKAIETWRPMIGLIEQRWQKRLGVARVRRLSEGLKITVDKVGRDLPDYLPILGYPLTSPAQTRPATADSQTLPALLAKALLAFAREFESASGVSLAISANILRLVDDDGIRIRELPRLSGVSKEAIAMGVNRLVAQGMATIRPVRTMVLTKTGRSARVEYEQLTRTIVERWRTTVGKSVMDDLANGLQQLVDGPLFDGLEPYADGWRVKVRKPEVLPHYPMILHRGGFPDGS